MKDLDLSQLFCEVLSGLVALFLVISVLSLGNGIAIDCAWAWTRNATLSKLTGLLLLAYMTGVVVDAIGLVFDKAVVDRWQVVRDYAQVDRSRFYALAPEHLFKYWNDQWTYVSCYRNLLMLAVPGLFVWTTLAYQRLGVCAAAICGLAVAALGSVLYVAIRELLTLYYRIPLDFGTTPPPKVEQEKPAALPKAGSQDRPGVPP